MMIPRSEYHVYLLRLWRDDESTPWRIQVQDPHTDETLVFTDLENLFAFLRQQAGKGKSHTEDDRPVIEFIYPPKRR
ncbi:MAG: hypothetical protein HYZ25_03055 [Chloroflexi bacterium]|nr:hypothetical protein [Chloroflexota bacterium]